MLHGSAPRFWPTAFPQNPRSTLQLWPCPRSDEPEQASGASETLFHSSLVASHSPTNLGGTVPQRHPARNKVVEGLDFGIDGRTQLGQCAIGCRLCHQLWINVVETAGLSPLVEFLFCFLNPNIFSYRIQKVLHDGSLHARNAGLQLGAGVAGMRNDSHDGQLDCNEKSHRQRPSSRVAPLSAALPPSL